MPIVKANSQEIEVVAGESIIDACEQLGVPFGCQSGVCGTCMTTVVSGMENLSDLSENEKDMGVEVPERLMCQCKILQGTVEISC